MSWLSAFSAFARPNLRASSRTRAFGIVSQRKSQARELGARGGEQEIALVALGIGRPVKRSPAAPVVAADDIMAGRQQIGAEVVGGVEKIGEFHVLIAGDAWDRSFAGDIGSGERLDHLLAKALLVIEHIMGNAEPRRDVPRIVDVLARRSTRPCGASLRRGRRAAS